MTAGLYISKDHGSAASHEPHPKDPEGHHLITRMNALVLLGRLDVVEVDRVVRDQDWKRARRLIRSVRGIQALRSPVDGTLSAGVNQGHVEPDPLDT